MKEAITVTVTNCYEWSSSKKASTFGVRLSRKRFYIEGTTKKLYVISQTTDICSVSNCLTCLGK